jgi:PAS domain S-box-containing protein
MAGHLPKQAPVSLSSSTILAQITDPVIAIDFESRVLFWNHAAEQLYRLTQQEILGQNISGAFIAEWPSGTDEQAIFEGIRETGRSSGETLQTLHDGRKLSISYEAYLLHGDHEEPVGYISILRHHSDDRRTEVEEIAAANRESEEANRQWTQLRNNSGVLENFLENLPACAFVKDERGRYLFQNIATRQAAPELANSLGKTDEEIFGREKGSQYRKNDVAVMSSGKPIRTIDTLTTENGERSFLSARFPIEDAKGNRYVGGVSVEMTESLREQEQLRKQAMLLDLASDAIYVADLTGRITYWSRGAERLYGWSSLEAVGLDANDLLKSKFETTYEQLGDELLRSGNSEAEVVHHRKDNEPITVSSRWSLLRDLNGLPTARLAINTDVTENRLAFEWLRVAEIEAARKASELQGVLDAMPAATFIAHDAECRNITSNRAAHDMLRLSHAASDCSLVEHTSAHRFTRDGRELPKHDLPLQLAASTGEPVINSEFSILFEDGISLDLLGNAVPLKNEAGEVQGAVGAFIDVTERNLAEKSARQHEAILRTVLENTSDFVFLKDCGGRYLAINPAGARLAGKTPEDFLGKDDAAVFPAEIAEQYMRRDREVIASGVSAIFEQEILLDGRTRILQTVRDLCRDADGRVIGVAGITRDVTEHKRLAADTDGKSAATVRLFVEAIERAADSFLVTEAEPINRPGPRISYVNDAFTRMTGYKREEVIGESPRILQGPKTDQAALNRIRIALETWQPVREELINYRKDGSEFWVDISIFPIANESGWYTHWVSIQRETTPQNIVRQQLEESEARLRRREYELSEAHRLACLGTWSWERETGKVTWSDGVYRLFDLDPTKAAPTLDEQATILTTDSLLRVRAALDRVVDDGLPYELDIELRLPTHGTRWAIVRGEVESYADGKPFRLRGTIQEITQRKRAEEQVRRANEELQTVLGSITEGLLILDKDWKFTFLNKQGAAILGADADRLIGHGVSDVFPEANNANSYEAFRRAIVTGQPVEFEEYYPEPANKWLECHCYPSAEGLSVYFRDVSARRRAFKAISDSELRFRTLAETLPQFIWVSNGKGVKTYCNQRYLDYTGVKSTKEMDEAWSTFIHPDDQAHTVEAWQHCLETGNPYTSSYRLRRYDGTYRHFLAQAVAVKNESGEIEQWLGSSTDVHEQKLVEEVLRRSEKLATAGRLAANIAHEINNPLAAISNLLYLSLEDEGLSESTRNYLKLADQELTRTAHVTTQTLKFHKQTSAPGMAHLPETIDSVLSVFEPRFEACSVSVERDYQTHEQLYCYSDELRQVFAHLLSNSLDATARGGRLRISVKRSHAWNESKEPGVRITVADTGIGIPSAIRKDVFDAFISTKESTGTGLGLWVTEGIVRKHGGKIFLRSRTDPENHGTVVTLFLPFAGLKQ